MSSDPKPSPDPTPPNETIGEPDPRMERVKEVSRQIEKRVRNALRDTQSDVATPPVGTEELPPLPEQS